MTNRMLEINNWRGVRMIRLSLIVKLILLVTIVFTMQKKSNGQAVRAKHSTNPEMNHPRSIDARP